jgi:hypothetical protein
MTRLLALAEFIYGAGVRRRVFEALAADWLRECGSRPPLALRARWWLAIVTTFLGCLPRAAFGDLSLSFGIDVAGRAIAFGALALAWQWLVGIRASGAAWPPSLLTTLPFIMVPVIWRLRLEGIPVHQQRLLTAAFTAACMIAGWFSGAPEWPIRAAIAISIVWLAIAGWRLGDYHLRHYSPYQTPWAYVIYPAAAIILSSWPIKIALGIGLFDSWWPGDNLIAYIVGALIGLSVKGRIERQIASR